jgi:hypothetical protein
MERSIRATLLARRREFVEPDQCDLPSPVSFPKIFHFAADPNHFISPAVPPHTEGRFAIVTDVGSGMRWTRMVLLTRAPFRGRRSRVVLTPRRWRQVGGSNSAGDGDKKARSPGRARRKPLKPLRAGMPGDPGATVVTCLRAFYFCTQGCGCNGHPAFPTPSVFGGEGFMHNSGASRRENANVYFELSALFENGVGLSPSSPRTRGPITTNVLCCAKLGLQFCLQQASVIMGPRVRGDDVERPRIRATRWLAMTAPRLNRLGR